MDQNAKLAELLVEILEMNLNIIHLNFDYTGLFKVHVQALISNLSKSNSLLCLHLGWNIDVDPDFTEWINYEIIAESCKREEEHEIKKYASAKK